MGVEKVNEIPEIVRGSSMKYRELVASVKSAVAGDIFKFINEDDDRKVNATTIRNIVEKNTKKIVLSKKYDRNTIFVKVLSEKEARNELEARKTRAIEMKKKLDGKKKQEK